LGRLFILGAFGQDFFKTFFQNNNLIDIVPGKVVPTWRNGRSGADLIAKRLDRFFISEEFLSVVGIYRSWVEYPFISDHALILLQLELPPLYKAYPFKLNPQWILEQGFIVMVQNLWNDPKYLGEDGKQKILVWKLKDLKACTKQWQKICNLKANSHLRNLENDIKSLIQNSLDGSSSPEEESLLKNLEQERNRLINESEELWRQRSRAIWIHSGDQNTKFFHNFANFRRNRKFVWEIMDEEGHLHNGQKNIKEEAVKHFKNFFKEQVAPSTNDQVRVAGLCSLDW
jgi:hypothetical protein